jgi:hypothetical protein
LRNFAIEASIHRQYLPIAALNLHIRFGFLFGEGRPEPFALTDRGMSRLRKTGIILLGLVAAWEAMTALFFPSSSLHYKLSLDIDDNGITRHGEGVIGVSFQSQGPLLISPTPQWWVDFSGEAFPIDLGARGTLFVLLAGDPKRQRPSLDYRSDDRYSPREAGRAALVEYFQFYVSGLPNGLGAKFKIDAFANSRTAVDLAPNALPKLVRFRDADDPKSAELVDPDHLDASFGPGVKILRAKAEITGEPITSGIEKRLKWVKSPAVMDDPGWSNLPMPTRVIITELFTGTTEEHFR